MYRKRFEPQLSRLPENYCGWAAERENEQRTQDDGERECVCEKNELPCPVNKKCELNAANDLSDIILIGAVIAFLLFMKGENKPDISLLVPLALLLFAK